jgi:hypothetical protein
MNDLLLPTSLVGSYAQPEWLIDRKNLAGRFPPRVRAKELWRVAPEYLDEAQDDATLLAIRDEERAGLDIITDGEQLRESYSNRFATALEGVAGGALTAMSAAVAALNGTARMSAETILISMRFMTISPDNAVESNLLQLISQAACAPAMNNRGVRATSGIE